MTTETFAERLAALKDRHVPAAPSVPAQLADPLADLDRQQVELLAVVSSLTDDVHDLAPRVTAEVELLLKPLLQTVTLLEEKVTALQAQIEASAERVVGHVDQAAFASVETLLSVR